MQSVTKKIDMQSVTKKIDMWSKEPAITYKKKNAVSMEEDQKSQVIICIDKTCQYRCLKSPRRPVCNDRKCPSTVQKMCSVDKNCQENMRPMKPQINRQLAKRATVRRLCKDPPCQSTRCYKKHSDPKKRQKMQYKVQYSWSVNQEDTTLDVTSEKLSPRSQKSQVPSKYKHREEINV